LRASISVNRTSWPRRGFRRRRRTLSRDLVGTIARYLFGIIGRNDILLVFDVPGKIYVRQASDSMPFVKEFYLPHAPKLGYRHTIVSPHPWKWSDDPNYAGEDVTDERFVKLRIGREAEPVVPT
jgi:hypothetical protein